MDDLALCAELSRLRSGHSSSANHAKLHVIGVELAKFGRSLRKFRKAQKPYKHIEHDRFEALMRDFKAQLACRALLEMHVQCLAIAQVLAAHYHFELELEPDDVICFLAKFISRNLNDTRSLRISDPKSTD